MERENTPTRGQGAQKDWEIRERRVVGNAERVGHVVNQLIDAGVFVGSSGLRFDSQVGSYAVVQYLHPALGGAPSTALAVRQPAAAVAVRRPEPARSRLTEQIWFRPALWTMAVLAIVVGTFKGIQYLSNQVAQATSGVNGKAVIGFVLIAVIVAIILSLRGKGGGGSGHGSGYGFHWSKCE